jgi:UDP-2,3-diacylglucosamine pyrophosphatase LpxH
MGCMIVAVSDIHLGKYEESETLFMQFLDYIEDLPDIKQLVLIGDIIDMWKSDADSLLERYYNVLKKIRNICTDKKVYYIVGNHDYNMIRRKGIDTLYNFQVYPWLILSSGDTKYYFIHGYQFEYPDDIKIYEEFANLLCFGGDVVGATVDFFWDLYKEAMFAVIMPKKWFYKNFRRSIKPPSERLSRKNMKRVNKNLDQWRRENRDSSGNTFIVYGHTHDPFVDIDRQVANAGSWVDDSRYPHLEKYTYLAIDDGTIKKNQFI